MRANLAPKNTVIELLAQSAVIAPDANRPVTASFLEVKGGDGAGSPLATRNLLVQASEFQVEVS